MMRTSVNSESNALYQEALATFRGLLDEARAAGDPEPTAMTLATCADDGRVCARVVLLKRVDGRGFRFFTNYESAKGTQLAAHPQVALCFHWKSLREQVQVCVEGRAERLSSDESDAYFTTRARGSQIGAWASLQSQPLADRAEFEARIAEFEMRFADVPVPRPPHWGGLVVVPDCVEFWYGAGFRLHERRRYERSAAGDWSKGLLYP
jgi:pyridoxamine 5'-phosphate oxidase